MKARLCPMSSFATYQSPARHPTVIFDENAAENTPEQAGTTLPFYDKHHVHNLVFTDTQNDEQSQNDRQWRVRARSGPMEYKGKQATYIQIVSYDLHLAMRNIVVMSREKDVIDAIIAAECDRIAHITSADAAQEMMQYRFAITNAMDREPDVRG